MCGSYAILRLLLAALLLVSPGAVAAEIRSADLSAAQTVTRGDWLRLKLDVLGLRLSFPAYRIALELTEENTIAFDFMLSGGLAEHLSDIGSAEAHQVLTYHAEGIGERVSELIKGDFQVLWSGFELEDDVAGRFVVPGEDAGASPRALATWRGGKLRWR